MVGVIVFFVVQVVLFGLTRAQCGTTCSGCKDISSAADPKFIGTWNLLDPLSSRCDSSVSCLYRRDSDGKEMCFCDPGTITYEKCPPFTGGLCYNYTDVDWYPTNFTNNDIPTCDSYCQDWEDTFFILGSTNLDDGVLCGCSWTQPDSSLVVDGSNCDIACPGNPDQTCGGFNNFNNNRYVNIWPIFPDAPPTDGDCYNTTDPIYPDCVDLPDNDVQACNSYNQVNNPAFTYFGLGSSILDTGVECCVGWTAPPADKRVHPSYCWVPCPGNPDQTCGAYSWNNHRYINIWARIY